MAFANLRWTHTPKGLLKPTINLSADQAERFQEDFESQTLDAVIWFTNALLGVPALKAQTSTVACDMGNVEDESIVTDEVVWQPSYILRFRDGAKSSETRLIGHVEFLAGRPGALTEACETRKTCKYGSLRCVLGDLAQWMLMNNHRYSFLVSSDEIMYFRMDVEHVTFKGKVVFCEPKLYYSHPMKLTNRFDAADGTITVRLGLLYFFWLVVWVEKSWQLPEEIGNCLNYAVFMDDGEDLRLSAPRIPEPAEKKVKEQGVKEEIIEEQAVEGQDVKDEQEVKDEL